MHNPLLPLGCRAQQEIMRILTLLPSGDKIASTEIVQVAPAQIQEEPTTVYPKLPFTIENAAAIPCAAVAGSYRVTFDRKEK